MGAKLFWVLPIIGVDGDTAIPQDDYAISSALTRHASLSNLLGEGRVGLVHGRMKSSDREKQINWFAQPNSGVDILVGTTVLEVGLDVPSATILIVEGANKFGLSQLHQLRGRVGRALPNVSGVGVSQSELKCHCVLLTDDNVETRTPIANERLKILCETDSGFQISLKDLKLRGPGEVLGNLQSGGNSGGFCVNAGEWSATIQKMSCMTITTN